MKNRKILCLFILILFAITGCSNDNSGTSFQKQMERQQAFEQSDDASPTPTVDNGEKTTKTSDAESGLDQILDGKVSSELTDVDGFVNTPLSLFDKFHAKCFEIAVPISAMSIIIGLIIFVFCRGNKGMRNMGLFGLMITIPLVMIFLTVGVSWLQAIFTR